MADHPATVQSIYAAFGRGDLPAILDCLSDDVAWEQWTAGAPEVAAVPWLRPRRGKSEVREFFEIVGSWRFTEFEVRGLLASADGTKVAAEISVGAEIPAGGVAFRDEELHLWTFDAAGKVASFRHYLDTTKHVAAALREGG